jgi:UDP-N-acetylglucosamine 4,6-dehydratase
MYVVESQSALWFRYDWSNEGKTVPDGFEYTSDNNIDWLTIEQIRNLIAPFEAGYKVQQG